MCVYMWVCSLCPWKPEDGIRFPINLIDWMTRKYPGSPCVLGFYCHDKILTQSNLVMKGFISFYSLQSIIEGSQCRNWRQGLMQRLWTTLFTGLFHVPCSACFLVSPGTTIVAPPTMSWILPYQSSIKKTHHRLCHRPVFLI